MTTEVKAKNTRHHFICSEKDRIMFNGSCYQLITQCFCKDWSYIIPVISKTEFDRLNKLGVLSEPYKQRHNVLGIKIDMTMYDFKEQTK